MRDSKMVELTDDRLTAAALAACAAFSDTLDLEVRPAVMVNPVAAVMAVESAIREALTSRAEGRG